MLCSSHQGTEDTVGAGETQVLPERLSLKLDVPSGPSLGAQWL